MWANAYTVAMESTRRSVASVLGQMFEAAVRDRRTGFNVFGDDRGETWVDYYRADHYMRDDGASSRAKWLPRYAALLESHFDVEHRWPGTDAYRLVVTAR